MIFKLFAMRDKTSGVFLQPFVSRSEIDAKRMLASAFDDPGFNQTPAGRYPQDFVLYEVGLFDDDRGEITGATPFAIATLSDLRPLPPASTVSS